MKKKYVIDEHKLKYGKNGLLKKCIKREHSIKHRAYTHKNRRKRWLVGVRCQKKNFA